MLPLNRLSQRSNLCPLSGGRLLEYITQTVEAAANVTMERWEYVKM